MLRDHDRRCQPSRQPTPPVPVLREPADGVPEPVTTAGQLREAIAGLGAGDGPLAVDAERASGYRYSQRAYLVQLRREGYGTVLIDPIAVPDLQRTQRGARRGRVDPARRPSGPRLPGRGRAAPVPAVRHRTRRPAARRGAGRAWARWSSATSGVGLEKGHSAADWSTRPLPHDWLVYAALDVELLIPLRAAMVDVLAAAGKTQMGRAGVRGRPHRAAAAAARRSMAAHVGHPLSAQPTPAGGDPGAVAIARRAGRASATSRPAGCCPTPRSSTRPARIPSRSTS